MKLQKTLLGVALAFAAASPAMALTTVTLDFNDLATPQSLATGYGNGGLNFAVTFDWTVLGGFTSWPVGATPTSSPSIYGPEDPAGMGIIGMTAVAGQTITNISFDYFLFTNATVQPVALQTLSWQMFADTGLVRFGKAVATLGSGGVNPVGTINIPITGPVTSLVLRLTNPEANIGYDNLTVTAVPEPSTYAMMLAGLGVAGFMARRRKAASSSMDRKSA